MSINSTESYTQSNNQIYGDYKFEDSSFRNVNSSSKSKANLNRLYGIQDGIALKEAYSVPLDFVRRECASASQLIMDTINDLENLMKKIFITPDANNDLLFSHQKLWDEVHRSLKNFSPDAIKIYNQRVKESNTKLYKDTKVTITEKDLQSSDEIVTIQPYPPPEMSSSENLDLRVETPRYICFDEINFAEKLNSTTSRRFLEEFYQSISHSTFSYFFQFRKMLKFFYKEVLHIQSSLNIDFGEGYENELQQKVAAQYDAWCKTAKHYTSRIAKTIISKPGEIPSAELDKVTKDHAKKFQAFFAIKLNAVDSEIEDILQSLKRDLDDNSFIFYTRYLSPGLKFSSEISNPLELDYQTTALSKLYPSLSEELLISTLILKGNFTSVMADLIDRHHIVMGKTDSLMRLIHEKRKYANFVAQLSNKGAQKPNLLMNIEDDVYSQIYAGAVISETRKDKTDSDHAQLSGLEDNDHPQYLLRDGGEIIGDIFVKEGVRIDGVDLSSHAHTGADGSAKISSLDIDYDSARGLDNNQVALAPISINVAKFNVDIVNGLPRCDAVLNIEVNDDTVNSYEYEIIYTEVI